MTSVVFYGVLFVYLLALIPAAVICCRKRQWLMFAAGWLTLGLVWFVGVASGESRRTLGYDALALIAAVLVIGAAYSHPAPVLGVDGGSLQASVSGFAPGGGGECRHLGAGGWQWECSRWDNQASGLAAYRVHVNRLGCWHGVEFGARRSTEGTRISGCVHLDDYL
jgi:hypothetical protein